MNRSFLTRYIWLSVLAAVTTILLKTGAWYLTGSIGLLSDAIESVINLLAALMAMAMLKIAILPPDKNHEFGHSKAEYFSSGIEGILILVAAVSIAITAVKRLMEPKPLEQVGIGLAVSVLASLINLFVALVLKKAGKNYRSITLEADAQHLMTDVWTSAGVLIGVGLVALTGFQRLDPVVALLVAANIVWSGVNIVRKSVMGLMDVSLPAEKIHVIHEVLDPYKQMGIQFHAMQTRQAGSREFISTHVLVPGKWTVQKGHRLIEKIEADIRFRFPGASVFTHLEPIEDSSSWDDLDL